MIEESARDAASVKVLRPLTIGIPAGSSEGAALCYRTICPDDAAFLGPHHPEVVLHAPSLSDYVEALERPPRNPGNRLAEAGISQDPSQILQFSAASNLADKVQCNSGVLLARAATVPASQPHSELVSRKSGTIDELSGGDRMLAPGYRGSRPYVHADISPASMWR